MQLIVPVLNILGKLLFIWTESVETNSWYELMVQQWNIDYFTLFTIFLNLTIQWLNISHFWSFWPCVYSLCTQSSWSLFIVNSSERHWYISGSAENYLLFTRIFFFLRNLAIYEAINAFSVYKWPNELWNRSPIT